MSPLRHMSVEREFRCRRVERLAIVKFDARSQLYGDSLAVGGGLVGEGELRHDLEVFIDVEQLVAQAGEDDAADVGSGCCGIKVVGIFGESDPERGLSQCRGGGHHDAQGDSGKNLREPHRPSLPPHYQLAPNGLIPQEARAMGWRISCWSFLEPGDTDLSNEQVEQAKERGAVSASPHETAGVAALPSRDRGRDAVYLTPTGSPEAVARPRFPQNPACRFPAPGSSVVGSQ